MAKFSDISPPIEKAQTPFQTRGIPGKSADLADELKTEYSKTRFSNSLLGKWAQRKTLKEQC